MSSQDDDSMLTRIRATGKGYRSLIADRQHYQTVGQALNSPVFWANANRGLGKAVRSIVKDLKKAWGALNKY